MEHCDKHNEDYNEAYGCDGCEAELEFVPPAGRYSFTVKCNECGYDGSIEAVQLHSCQIQQQGGRCEDFPCCGHTDGDGCQQLPEHTSEYWMNLQQQLGDRYDELDQMGAWDRE
jgi:hypothetical protein